MILVEYDTKADFLGIITTYRNKPLELIMTTRKTVKINALTRDQAMKIVEVNPDAMTAIRMTEAVHGINELQPLTRDQAMKIVEVNPDAMTAIRMTEAAHGIK